MMNHGYSMPDITKIMGTNTFHTVSLFLGSSRNAILGMVGTGKGHCTGGRGGTLQR